MAGRVPMSCFLAAIRALALRVALVGGKILSEWVACIRRDSEFVRGAKGDADLHHALQLARRIRASMHVRRRTSGHKLQHKEPALIGFEYVAQAHNVSVFADPAHDLDLQTDGRGVARRRNVLDRNRLASRSVDASMHCGKVAVAYHVAQFVLLLENAPGGLDDHAAVFGLGLLGDCLHKL
eukprot:2172009-Pleurochrysis_carterae.AAC.2